MVWRRPTEIVPLLGWFAALGPGVADTSLWSAVKQSVSLIAEIFVIIGALIGFGLWLTGGLQTGTQVAVATLTMDVAEVKKTLVEMNKALQSMPRPSDYEAHEKHLSNLDAQVGTINDKLQRDEVDAAGTKALVQQLRDSSAGGKLAR